MSSSNHKQDKVSTKEDVAEIKRTPKDGKLKMYDIDKKDFQLMMKEGMSFDPKSFDVDTAGRIRYDHLKKKGKQ
ncbi:hypothetical protein ACHQM5_026865 [Ranunculus cassubicifolius]